ncbi:MAG: AAA family ATPase [Ignavibacteria bacterium]|nr:AAA family ATPase [Ignavibacteria bacterium]
MTGQLKFKYFHGFPFSFPDDLQKIIHEKSNKILRKLGVYGFDHLELLILASLVSEDPLLLVGKAGTGKTYLLNSISEALNLEHRHYNASFLSFDDLVGFPFPDSKGKTVSFLKTPATIWDAESVLIDKISRCKPEIQNKFFSIIHEKKLQVWHWKTQIPLGCDESASGVSAGADDFTKAAFHLIRHLLTALHL